MIHLYFPLNIVSNLLSFKPLLSLRFSSTCKAQFISCFRNLFVLTRTALTSGERSALRETLTLKNFTGTLCGLFWGGRIEEIMGLCTWLYNNHHWQDVKVYLPLFLLGTLSHQFWIPVSRETQQISTRMRHTLVHTEARHNNHRLQLYDLQREVQKVAGVHRAVALHPLNVSHMRLCESAGFNTLEEAYC